jgi:hypothetical protein
MFLDTVTNIKIAAAQKNKLKLRGIFPGWRGTKPPAGIAVA